MKRGFCLAVFIFLSGSETLFAEKEKLGGSDSVPVHGAMAFELHFPSLPIPLRAAFQSGNSFFEQNWVASPASTKARQGLGPLFNARSCSSCHMKDGRGSVDFDNGLLLKFSGNPAYGSQLQHKSLERGVDSQNQNRDVKAEAELFVEYAEFEVSYADGKTVNLRRPHYRIARPAYGPLGENYRISPRLAPQLIGLGLVEAIPDESFFEEEKKQQHEGLVSGRAHRLKSGGIGRFGWKAEQPSLKHQAAAAFRNDMGISNELFPDENCSDSQTDCLALSHTEGEYELDPKTLERVTQYLQFLAVPTRRLSESSLHGEKVFQNIGCENCHRSSWLTADEPSLPDALRAQTIFPYSDFLLHDMGEDLADHHPALEATGREWRTPPLWGLGLAQKIHPETGFLHDGRARSFEEAILWHGGEAEFSKEAFRQLPAPQRQQLLDFLLSL